MAFNSYIFLFVFLPLVIIGYYGLQYKNLNKVAQLFLISMSLLFCAYVNFYSVAVMLISACLNYLIVQKMWKILDVKMRRIWLISGICMNVLGLFIFKYTNFFLDNVNTLFGTDYSFLQIMLPLGISFYTFQEIAYLVDSYRRECENYKFLEYLVGVTFFPKLIQGPIVYLDEIILPFREEANHKINYENMSKGIYAFACGLAKKVLLADTLSKLVEPYYHNPNGFNATTTIFVMIWYSLQIYFDFSGYCDMAIGIGLMFNVKLPSNFSSPYKADNIDAFWNSWHMTLTRFFTKYLYIPLGGNRKGKARTYLNIFLVFIISGLWHGANWTFVLWGAMHGVAKIVGRIMKRWSVAIPKIVKFLFTFSFVTFAWSLFRAKTISQAKEMWGQLIYGGYGNISSVMTDIFNEMLEMKIIVRLGFDEIISGFPSLVLCLFTFSLLFICFFTKNVEEKISEWKYSNKKIVAIVLMIFWSVISLTEGNAFLYANF